MPRKSTLRGLGLIGVLFITLACGLLAGAPATQTAPAALTPSVPLPVEVTQPAAATVPAGAESSATPTTTAAATASTAATATVAAGTPTAASSPTGSTQPAMAVLLAEGDLWVYLDGSAPRQITTSGDIHALSVAPDGAWVAFLRSNDQIHFSLWAAQMDGSGAQELMRSADLDALPRPPEATALSIGEMQWVPGGQTLAFSTRPIFEGPGPGSSEDLWLVEMVSGARRQLLAPGEGGAFTFSPDGQQIALAKADSISLINIDGSNRRERVLTYPFVSTYSEWIYYPEVHWAADSSALRVVIPPEAALERPEEPATIWSVPADGSTPQQLGAVIPRPLTFPRLSPDGMRVAYVRAAGAPAANQNELHIANADGTQDVLYQVDEQLDFTGWSPDSQQFMFSVPGDPFRSYVGRVGETPLPLSDTPNAFNVQWLDENRFLFVTRTALATELRLGRAGAPSQLIHSTADPFGTLNFSIAR